MTATAALTIERLPISRINPAPYNPRLDLKPGDEEYERIARSLSEFGYVDPLVWNRRTGNLVGGHQRLKVLMAGGATEADVSVVDLDESRERLLNLALNKIAGAWDDHKLADLLAELQRDATVDETLSGFNFAEIDDVLDRVTDEPYDGSSDDGKTIRESYAVLVCCPDEADQEQLYRRFTDDGRDCRVLTMPPPTQKRDSSPAGDMAVIPAKAIRVDVSCPVARSFRVDQVAGMFDVQLEAKSSRSWIVELPDTAGQWHVGAIVGPSGSGKSVIARQAFANGYTVSYEWPADRAIIDAFPEAASVHDITAALNAVGFSSPPDWVKPFGVLSVGQQFRANLARALLSPAPVIAFDEFTSTVDRQVAQFGSAAVARAVRGSGRKFVAVTCHYDVLDWLQPDWVLDTADAGRLLRRGRDEYRQLVKPRPPIQLDIRRAPRRLWAAFEHHHYLSPTLHRQSRCYAAVWRDRPIAFCAVIQNMGHKGRRRVHRLVVLPDYQGMGVGLRLLDAVAAHESRASTVTIRTSHPALIRSLAARDRWRCIGFDQTGSPHSAEGRRGSVGRTTASFEWTVPPAKPPIGR